MQSDAVLAFIDATYKRVVKRIGEDGRRRCSPEQPCDGRLYPNGHPTHILLWGECWTTKGQEPDSPRPVVCPVIDRSQKAVTCSSCGHERPYVEGMPWWRDDPVVVENGWMNEHCCPECGRHTHDDSQPLSSTVVSANYKIALGPHNDSGPTAPNGRFAGSEGEQ